MLTTLSPIGRFSYFPDNPVKCKFLTDNDKVLAVEVAKPFVADLIPVLIIYLLQAYSRQPTGFSRQFI